MKKKAKILGSSSVKPARTPLKLPLRGKLVGLELIQVERAAGDIRAGLPVVIHDQDGSALSFASETMNFARVSETIAALRSADGPYVLLTPERASALKIRRYTKDVLAVSVTANATAIMATQDLADPSRDLINPLRGPFDTRREALPSAASAAVLMMKHAHLLPSALTWFLNKPKAKRLAQRIGLLEIDAKLVRNYRKGSVSGLRQIASANLPLKNAPTTRVIAFRPPSGAREHLILLIGDPSPSKPPLVRVHSECFTGDLLGSLKCDCGDQLRGAIQLMGANPDGGVLLYLAQEGRGIGLINKLRAYDLQDQGFDTIDANVRLGFEADERQFEVASELLNRLGFKTIRLLTNNPEKVSVLKQQGIKVAERVPHAFPANPHNETYLRIKARKTGHLL